MSEVVTAGSLDAPQENRRLGALSGALHSLRRPELIAALCLFAVLLAMLAAVKVIDVLQLQGDAAIFLQATENAAFRGVPLSGVFANTQAFLDSHLLVTNAQQMATDPLAPPAIGERNILGFHFYAILYPLALFARFIPVDVVLAIAFMASYLGLVLCAYLVLRRRRVDVAAALLFCLLVISHPAWGETLWGQFYPDRLFVLAGFIFMVLFSRARSSQTALIAAAVACVLIGERAALTAGLFALAYVGLNWRGMPESERNLKVGIGVGMLAFGVLVTKLAISNAYYSSFMPTSLDKIVLELQSPVFIQDAVLFLAVNAVLFAIALFAWRAAVIAAFLMIPNLLGNIGGAEKIGWVTHYHSYYFPVLVWAAAAGFVNAYRIMHARRQLPALYAGTAVLALLLTMIDPFSPQALRLDPSRLSAHVIIKAASAAQTFLTPAGMQVHALADQIRAAVPENTTVTMPESVMPFLYHDRTLHVLPVGVDRADYAIMTVTGESGGQPVYGGVPTYLGPEEGKKINATIVERMRAHGYDLAHPVLIPALSLAVVKRVHG